MKIALIGYGKMGKAIEEIALGRGHSVVLKIDEFNIAEFNPANLAKADVAIEFTSPHSALENVTRCLQSGCPTVCGSTGWTEHLPQVKALCDQRQGSFLYASNFSIGVNIFFELNRFLASLMQSRPDYEVSIEEIHHTQKKDAPSGTAITLAEQIMQEIPGRKTWVNNATANPSELGIISKRIDPAPGTHTITYHSAIDDIEIKHTAHNRQGFALGAVLAAEYIHDKKGWFTMKDVLRLS